VSNIVTGEQGSGRPSTWQRAVVRARRLSLLRMVLVGLLALVLGVGIGRWTVPEGNVEARQAVERTLLQQALDSDGIWTSGAGADRPAVSEGLIRLRATGPDEEVHGWTEDWISAYDSVLVRMTGLDLPAEARPVQRQFIAAVTLTRDAVEVLRHAAEVEDDATRELLLTEVLRLRQRSEDLTQAARASVRDLAGGSSDVAGLTRNLPEF
jgi:uncharacterized protein YjeT (DUF2065 family)